MYNAIKRKKVFVSHEIQGRILMRVGKYWLFYNFALWHSLLLIDYQRYGIPAVLNGGERMTVLEFYADFAAQHVTLLVLAVALSPIVLWDMLKLTHQIAGPLVRFRQTLHKMALGQPVEKIKLRDGDLLIEFQDAFNELLESDRLLVGPRPSASSESAVGSQEQRVLDSATELHADLNTRNCEQAPSATTRS
jgi:hypothetical protein